jgi:predicted transcriptional regulator
MNTKIIFNTNKKLKSAAQKKARAQGLTLSAMLNLATRAFVDNDIIIDVIARDLAEARQGKSIPAAEVYRRLGIKK